MTAPAVIALHGPLNEAAAALIVRRLRNAAGRDVDLRINSRGGQLFGAIKILLELEEHVGVVTTTITGEACSAAFLVAAAGDWRQVDRRGAMMVHHPRPRSAEVSADIVAAVGGYSGQPPTVVRGWLDAEHAFSPAEAKRLGIVDSVVDVDAPRPVRLRPLTKRRPAAWLKPWREFCERLDLR
jgi:ATP-dependent Clp protease, protease subunit